MTRDHTREVEASCLGKDQLTRELAQQIAKRSTHRANTAYRCEHCNHWHVGQSNRMVARRGR